MSVHIILKEPVDRNIDLPDVDIFGCDILDRLSIEMNSVLNGNGRIVIKGEGCEFVIPLDNIAYVSKYKK